MKINLNVAEDEQLRKEVREMIKGQVDGLTREQVKEMIISALGEKKLTPQRIDEIAQSNVRSIFENWAHDGNMYMKNFSGLKTFLKVEIKKAVDGMKDFIQGEISKHVNSIVEQTMKDMIAHEVEKAVKKKLKDLLA